MYYALLIATLGTNLTADFLDRRTTRGSDPYSLTLWTGIVQFLLIVPLIGFVGTLAVEQLFACLVVGTLASLGRIRWYTALSDAREQLSRLAPFLRLSSVFVFVMAVVVLGERPSALKVVGAGLIIVSALLVSLERASTSLRGMVANNRAALLVMTFAVSTAAIGVLYKYLLVEGVSIWASYFYVRLFQLVPILIIGFHRSAVVDAHMRISNLRLFVFTRVLQTAAAFMYLLVLRHLPLTTVEPLGALSPFLLLAAERVMARVRPDDPVAPEAGAPARRVIALRAGATLAVAAGVVLLTLG